MAPSDNDQLQLRRYLETDHDEVVRLHHLGLEQFGADAGPGPWDDDLEDIPSHYFERGDFIVGTMDGRLVAMGAVRGVSSEAAEIKRMRVLQGFQRRGFGHQILEALETRAADLGYARLFLDTSEYQVPAQAFYLKHGFREVRRDDSTQPALIHFEKDLSPTRSTPSSSRNSRRRVSSPVSPESMPPPSGLK